MRQWAGSEVGVASVGKETGFSLPDTLANRDSRWHRKQNVLQDVLHLGRTTHRALCGFRPNWRQPRSATALDRRVTRPQGRNEPQRELEVYGEFTNFVGSNMLSERRCNGRSLRVAAGDTLCIICSRRWLYPFSSVCVIPSASHWARYTIALWTGIVGNLHQYTPLVRSYWLDCRPPIALTRVPRSESQERKA